MAKKYFKYSEADYIKVQFKCSCGEIVTSKLLPIKDAFDLDTDFNHIDYPIECVCGKKHVIEVSDNLISSECKISSIDDDSFICLHEIPYEYAANCDCSFVDFIQDIVKLKSFVEKIDNQTLLEKEYLNELLFVHVISIMDAYANSNFVYLLTNYSEFFEAFRQNTKMYKKKSKQDVLDSLRYRSFQDLNTTIIPFYRDAFGIEIPNNEILSKAVEIRNCIMHHNGRDIDGYKHVISIGDIINVIEQVEALVKEIRKATDEAIFELLRNRGIFKNTNQ